MDNSQFIKNSLEKTLKYAEVNEYKGYNKYDALDSKLLMALSFGNKYLRLLYSQAIMRFPINIRPLFFVPKTRNPKGIALFAMSYMNLYKATNEKIYLDKAEDLLKWLIDNPSSKKWGNCWGYQHPWQDVGFFAPAHLPNRVVTYFVLTAMLDAYEITRNELYLNVAKNAIPFIKDAPKVLFEDDTMKAMSYVPVDSINWIVMDVSILCGSILSRINKYVKDEEISVVSRKLVKFVVDKMTDYGAWYYTYPSGDHPRQHDNYHTGYIVDAIYDYTKNTGDKSFMKEYLEGIEYYYNNLFLEDGTPKWENNKIYPVDVHGSAQGIISFVKASEFDEKYLEFAEKIAEWAITNMQNEKKGFFYYQKTKYFRKPFTLMRWSNGWMSRGLSVLYLKLSTLK